MPGVYYPRREQYNVPQADLQGQKPYKEFTKKGSDIRPAENDKAKCKKNSLAGKRRPMNEIYNEQRYNEAQKRKIDERYGVVVNNYINNENEKKKEDDLLIGPDNKKVKNSTLDRPTIIRSSPSFKTTLSLSTLPAQIYVTTTQGLLKKINLTERTIDNIHQGAQPEETRQFTYLTEITSSSLISATNDGRIVNVHGTSGAIRPVSFKKLLNPNWKFSFYYGGSPIFIDQLPSYYREKTQFQLQQRKIHLEKQKNKSSSSTSSSGSSSNLTKPKNKLITVFNTSEAFYNDKAIEHKLYQENDKESSVSSACITETLLTICGKKMASTVDINTGRDTWSSQPKGFMKNATGMRKKDIFCQHKLLMTCKQNPESNFFATSSRGDLQWYDRRAGITPIKMTSILDLGVFNKNNKQEQISSMDQSLRNTNLLCLGGSSGSLCAIDLRKLRDYDAYDQDRIQDQDKNCVVQKFMPGEGSVLSVNIKEAMKTKINSTPMLIATGGVDRKLRIFDIRKRDVMDMMYLGSRITNVAFVRNANVYADRFKEESEK